MFYVLLGSLIGFVIGVIAVCLTTRIPKQNGYTQTYIRGDCRDTVTFNPTETIITIQVDWNRYGSLFEPHMGAISDLISIAYQGEDGTPLKYLKQIEQSQIERHEQKERIDQHIEKLKEKNEILIKERDEIQNTYRALKQYLRDCYNGAKSWLDQTEERFHNEPPF